MASVSETRDPHAPRDSAHERHFDLYRMRSQIRTLAPT